MGSINILSFYAHLKFLIQTKINGYNYNVSFKVNTKQNKRKLSKHSTTRNHHITKGESKKERNV